MLTPRTPSVAPTADEYDAAQARGGGERAPEKYSKREDFYSADKRKAPADLARAHCATVHRFSGVRHSLGTGDAIRAALESGGVEFTNGDAPGVRLKPKG